MKFSFVLLLCPFFLQHLTAQDKLLRLSHPLKNKVVVFQEMERIKIKTIKKRKRKGKFSIIDEKHILIKSDTIALSSITQIKHHPISREFTSRLVSAYAMLLSSTGYFLFNLDDMPTLASISLAFVPISLFYTIKGLNVYSGHKRSKQWVYDILIFPSAKALDSVYSPQINPETQDITFE